MVLVYNDTIHNFGGATDTGVANVTMFMDVSPLAACDDNDQTGTEIDGGGGMDGDANPIVSTRTLQNTTKGNQSIITDNDSSDDDSHHKKKKKTKIIVQDDTRFQVKSAEEKNDYELTKLLRHQSKSNHEAIALHTVTSFTRENGIYICLPNYAI